MTPGRRQPRRRRRRCTSRCRSARTPPYLMVGERTNTNGSKAFREAMLDGRWDDVVEIAQTATREGAHMIDVCVDYVGRDGTADMREVAGRFATVVHTPDHARLHRAAGDRGRAGDARRARCHQLGQLRGRRRARTRGWPGSCRSSSSTAPRSSPCCIDEQGQARTADWKVRVAERLIDDLVAELGHPRVGHPRRRADLHPRHRPGGVPQRRRRDDRGDPRAQAPPPGRADHLGAVQHLVRAQAGRARGAELGVPGRVRRRPGWTRRSCTHPRSCRCPGSRTSSARSPSTWSTTAAARGTTRCTRFLELFEGVDAVAAGQSRAEELAALPLDERLQRRIVDGERNGLDGDLDEALRTRPALEIINDTLLGGMKTVGELFGSGQMQLPFVLQSAEVMKAAVAHLEPHMEKADVARQGHASCWPPSRATSTTSARTSSTSSCPTTATRWSTSASSSRSRDPRRGRRARRRRDRHVRAAGQVARSS